MKKFIKIIVFTVGFAALLTGTVKVQAEQLDTKMPNIEKTRFSYIEIFSNYFDISASGKAEMSSSLYATGADEIQVYAYLQKYSGGTWTTVSTYSSREAKEITGISGTRYVLSGYYYRFVSHAYVYIDDMIVENDVFVSSSIYY